MKVGDKVQILPPISPLQSKEAMVGKDVIRGQYGTVTAINGAYVLVRPKRRRWEADCLMNELQTISKEEFKKVENYVRKYE
jgi:hypothetical protein